MEDSMAYAFALNGNEPITSPAQKEKKEEFTLEWFKQQLIEAGVSALYITWGNYKEEFPEVPSHLMYSYLHHRKRVLHKQALARAEEEYLAMEAHPFAL